MNIANKIYELRKDKGYSQEELADILGVSRQAVSKWESGQAIPESDKLLKISEHFQISLDELMKNVSSTTNNDQNIKRRFLFPLFLSLLGLLVCGVLFLTGIFSSATSDPNIESINISLNFNAFTLSCGAFALLFLAGVVIFAVLHFLPRNRTDENKNQKNY